MKNIEHEKPTVPPYETKPYQPEIPSELPIEHHPIVIETPTPPVPEKIRVKICVKY